jgi:hypothetical protein
MAAISKALLSERMGRVASGIELSGSRISRRRVAGNEVLAQILTGLVSRSSLVTLLFQSNWSVLCSTDEHAAVLDALRRGDVKLAIRLMDEHLVHVERDLGRLPKEGAPVDLEEALGFSRIRMKGKVAA